MNKDYMIIKNRLWNLALIEMFSIIFGVLLLVFGLVTSLIFIMLSGLILILVALNIHYEIMIETAGVVSSQILDSKRYQR